MQKTTYDPKEHGAKCDRCAIGVFGKPAPHETRITGSTLSLAIIHAAPPREFAMNSLNDIIAQQSVKPEEVVHICATACSTTMTNAKMRDLCKGAAEEGRKVLMPDEACRARFLADMDRACDARAKEGTDGDVVFVPMGTAALAELLNVKRPSDYRGFPLRLVRSGSGHARDFTDIDQKHHYRVLPTAGLGEMSNGDHVAQVISSELAKAIAWSDEDAEFLPSNRTYAPKPAEVERFLMGAANIPIVLDIEPTGIDVMTSRIRVLGLTDGADSIIIPFLSKKGGSPFYTSAELQTIRGLLSKHLVDREEPIIGHNVIGFDLPILRNELGLGEASIYVIDTMILDRTANPGMPHSLREVATRTTFVGPWKSDRFDHAHETDEDLWRYNATDIDVTAEAFTVLGKQGVMPTVVDREHSVMHLASRYTQVGLRVDSERHRELYKKTFGAMRGCLEVIERENGGHNLNPFDYHGVARRLFEQWQLMPPAFLDKRVAFTSAGNPSANDAALLGLLTSGTLDAHQHSFVEAVLTFRQYAGDCGAFLCPMYGEGDAYIEDSYTVVEALDSDLDFDGAENAVLFGQTGRDGVIHPLYQLGNIHGRLRSTGRFNAIGLPAYLREIIVADQDRVLVKITFPGLEFRLAALFFGWNPYLDAMQRRRPLDTVSAIAAFGDEYQNIPADSVSGKKLRALAHRMAVATAYGDDPMPSLIGARDSLGRILTPNLKRANVEKMRALWMDALKIERSWDRRIEMLNQGIVELDLLWQREPRLPESAPRSQILGFWPGSTATAYIHEFALTLFDDMQVSVPSGVIRIHSNDGILVQVSDDDFDALQRLIPMVKQQVDELAKLPDYAVTVSASNGMARWS